MARQLPSLNGLKAFESAARNASFTRAAAELSVSHAAISRHIRELEAWLGAKLFVRTGRGVELTERGKDYVAELTRGFDLIAAATESVSRRRRRRQQLVVTAEPSFAALWLIPRLGRFTASHPEVELQLDAVDRLVDFSRNEADIGIRYGRGTWSNVAAERVAVTNLTPMCSPAFLRTTGVKHPADLKPHQLLQEEARQYWTAWLKEAGLSGRMTPEGPTLSGHLTIPAAEAGQGFALADQVIAGDALVGGRLVRPFALSISGYGYYFVRAPDRKESRAMSAFHAWLKAEMEQTVDAVRKAAPAGPAGKSRSKIR